jgi:diadenosine tetraphosphate (Ap4A) HIT family hydrolase
MTCVLCTALPGDVVFETADAAVVLHEDWSPRGHAMIVAKQHVENAHEAPPGFFDVWQKAERAILDATGKERAMILKLGIAAPHLHVHIYPMSADATRQDVFDAFDGKAKTGRDAAFVEKVRLTLTAG